MRYSLRRFARATNTVSKKVGNASYMAGGLTDKTVIEGF